MHKYAILLLSMSVTPAIADSDRIPEPVVLSSRDGTCYARSVPTNLLGTAGITRVYDVGKVTDTLRDTYNWYSYHLYPWCFVYLKGFHREIGLVRLGKWAIGQSATEKDIAISFFVGGKLVREYSMLDIAGKPDNVHSSVSHYVVFGKIAGFVDLARDPIVPFEVQTVDGRSLEFDPSTGEELTGRLRGGG